jgi:hypothetical protein
MVRVRVTEVVTAGTGPENADDDEEEDFEYPLNPNNWLCVELERDERPSLFSGL